MSTGTTECKLGSPIFPGLTIPGDRLADTLFYGPYALREHIEELIQSGLPVPEPTTPDSWAIHDKHPEALVGFVEVDVDRSA